MAHAPAPISETSGYQSSQGAGPVVGRAMRIKSEDLFQQQREIEIEHQGRIYRLRLTQLNKLILTA